MDAKQLLNFIMDWAPVGLRFAGITANRLVEVLELFVDLADENGVISGKTGDQLAEVLGFSRRVIYIATDTLEKLGIIEKIRPDCIGKPISYKIKI